MCLIESFSSITSYKKHWGAFVKIQVDERYSVEGVWISGRFKTEFRPTQFWTIFSPCVHMTRINNLKYTLSIKYCTRKQDLIIILSLFTVNFISCLIEILPSHTFSPTQIYWGHKDYRNLHLQCADWWCAFLMSIWFHLPANGCRGLVICMFFIAFSTCLGNYICYVLSALQAGSFKWYLVSLLQLWWVFQFIF